MMLRRNFVSLTAALAAAPLLARAQAWPTHPLHIVVPFPPGGTTDYVTRLVGSEVGRGLGQQVVVARIRIEQRQLMGTGQ